MIYIYITYNSSYNQGIWLIDFPWCFFQLGERTKRKPGNLFVAPGGGTHSPGLAKTYPGEGHCGGDQQFHWNYCHIMRTFLWNIWTWLWIIWKIFLYITKIRYKYWTISNQTYFRMIETSDITKNVHLRWPKIRFLLNVNTRATARPGLIFWYALWSFTPLPSKLMKIVFYIRMIYSCVSSV